TRCLSDWSSDVCSSDLGLNVDASVIQITHAYHPEPSCQARVSRDAWVSSADVLAPPVVVHLINAVDEDEARLCKVICGRHDEVRSEERRVGKEGRERVW